MILYSGLCKGFFAFAAGTADTAMMLTAFVAGPSLRIIKVQFFAFGGDLRLGKTGVGREELYTVPSPESD